MARTKEIRTGPPDPTIADVYEELKTIRSTLDKVANDVEALKKKLDPEDTE